MINPINRSYSYFLAVPIRIVLPWTLVALGIIGTFALVYKYRSEIARLFSAKQVKKMPYDHVYEAIINKKFDDNLFLAINQLKTEDNQFENIKNAILDTCRHDEKLSPVVAKSLLFASDSNRTKPNNCLAIWLECEKFIFKNEKDKPYNFEFMKNCLESTLNCTPQIQKCVISHLMFSFAQSKQVECFLFFHCLSEIVNKHQNIITTQALFLKNLYHDIKNPDNHKLVGNLLELYTMDVQQMCANILDTYLEIEKTRKICLLWCLKQSKKEINIYSQDEKTILNVKKINKIEENLGMNLEGDQLSQVTATVLNEGKNDQEKDKKQLRLNQATPKPITRIIYSYL